MSLGGLGHCCTAMRLKFHWSLLLLACSLSGLQHRAAGALEGKHTSISDACCLTPFIASCRSVESTSSQTHLTSRPTPPLPPPLFCSLPSTMFVQRKRHLLGLGTECVKFGTFPRCCGVPQVKTARGLGVEMFDTP